MPDQETTEAFRRVEASLVRLGEKMDSSTGEIHSRINDLVSIVGEANTKIAAFGSELRGHVREDDAKFGHIDDMLKEGKRDRMGIWKIIAGGGLGAAIVKALTALGLMGRTPHG